MSRRTYDELIAGLGNRGETLMHFNEKHDSKGRFAKKSGGSSSSSSKNMIGPQRKDPFLGVSLEWVGDSQRFGIDEFGANTGMSPEDIDHVYANPPDGWGINDVSEVVGSGIAWSIRTLVNSYMQSPAYSYLMNGEYHTEQEFLTGSSKLADRVYADMCNMFKSSEVISEYLKSDEGKAEVVEIVGSQLGTIFANQTAPTPQETLNAKKREKTYQDASHKTESKSVHRRELTRDDVKKEYPDLPSAAIDSIYNSLSDKHQKVKGAAGNTDRVKHDDMSSVLAHFNSHHDPNTGQFTTANGSTGGIYMRTYEELLAAQTELAHFNPNHDPRNGQFAKSFGGIASTAATTASNQKAKIRNTAVRAKRVPERAMKVKRIGAFTAAGAATGASIALGLMSAGLGALPIAAVGAASKAVLAGTAFLGSWMGGVAGLGAGIIKEEMSDYLKGKGADKEDWDRYIRSNTNYDRLM